MSTKIEWTDVTWNPVRGCSRVSEGCRNCYAEMMAARFSDQGMAYEGLATRNPARWTGEVRLVWERLEDPRHWKKPRRVFVNSMSDLFHEGLTFEEIDRVCLEMALARRHTFQVLTKRPERMLEYVLSVPERATGSGIPTILNIGKAWPPRNIHFGVSVEDQPTFDKRVPVLQQVPAWTRFLSCEPLLGAISGSKPGLPAICNRPDPKAHGDRWPHVQHIDWVIVGGESGPGARPCDISNVRSIVEQCKSAGVACFVKQLGAKPFMGVKDFGPVIRDRKGGDIEEFPVDLRVRQFPNTLNTEVA